MPERSPPRAGPFEPPADEQSFRGVRDGVPGSLTLGDPVVWRSERGAVDRVPISQVTGLHADRVSWVRLYLFGAGGMAGLLAIAGFDGAPFLAPFWLFIPIVMAADRLAGHADLTIYLGDAEEWRVRVHDGRAYGAATQLRRQHYVLGRISMGQMVGDAWHSLLWPDPSLPIRPQRGLGLWVLMWTYLPPMVAVLAVQGLVVRSALTHQEALPPTLAVTLIAIPALWLTFPVLGLPGLYAQQWFTWLLPTFTGQTVQRSDPPS